jgi:hypothetical protein
MLHSVVPKLFGVEDIVDVVKPDERSVMTYVAQYFHVYLEILSVRHFPNKINLEQLLVESVNSLK